jgi:transposase
MRLGRPLPELKLTTEENNRLIEWSRRRTTAQALALRARIVLACAQGGSNIEVAQRLKLTKQTVGKWRARFIRERLDGLLDAPRPGQPRKISDAHVERVLALTLERKPRAATHWSSRLMARESGLNQTAITRIWRAFSLQPHRQESFNLSTDPLFIDKVRDIVALSLNPPTRAVVLCVDEKSQIQALDRTQPLLLAVLWGSRAAHPRLSAPRHYDAVCGTGTGHGQSHWRVAPAPSRQ